MMMFYSLLTAVFTATTALTASERRMLFPEPKTHVCGAQDMDSDIVTFLRTDAFCRQTIVVPKGHVVDALLTNKEAYCGLLSEAEKKLAQISYNDSSLVNFCTSELRTFKLPEGIHYVGVSAATTPLRLSLAYHNTILDCNDIVRSSLVDVVLTFVPTKHKCSIVLPGRTVLHFKNIQRTADSHKNPQLCPRVRMGQNMWSLNTRWQPMCELPSDDSIEYELGCGAVVLDSSSLATRKIEFVLTPMTGLKAVTAPLMCSDADLGWAANFPPRRG